MHGRGLLTLQAERLLLRGLRPGDEELLASLDADPAVRRWIHDGAISPDRALKYAEMEVETAAYRINFGKWMITLRSTAEAMGWVEIAKYRGPRIDETMNDYLALGYQMGPKYWGRGYMYESCRAILDYTFNKLDLDRVLAFARPENVRSIKLIERLGFGRIGHCPDEAGNTCDLFMLWREEWPGG